MQRMHPVKTQIIIDPLDITNPHCKTMYDPVIYLAQWKEGVFGITSKILESDNFFSLESPQWGYWAFLDDIHSRILPFRYIPQCNNPWKRLKLNTWLLACRGGFIIRFKNINQVREVWFFFLLTQPRLIKRGTNLKHQKRMHYIRSTCPIWPRNYPLSKIRI